MPRRPPLLCPGLFPCSTFFKIASLHRGLGPFQSIHPSIVVRLMLAKVSGSIWFRAWTMADALIFHPTCFTAILICDQQNGVCQLWYFAGLASFFCLWPLGFVFFNLIFSLRARAGCVSSAMFVFFAGPRSANSRSLIWITLSGNAQIGYWISLTFHFVPPGLLTPALISASLTRSRCHVLPLLFCYHHFSFSWLQ